MSQGKQPQGLPPGKIIAARNIVHRYPSLLDTDETFTVDDLPGKWNKKSQFVLRKLITVGALTKLSHEHQGNGRYYCKYQWKEGVQQELAAYVHDLDTLPCGHRIHIKHKKNGGFGCRYCDEEQHYNETLIRELTND